MSIIKTNNKGLLIVVSGPSGAGKGTINGELLKRNKNIWMSTSMTTREPRGTEENGKEYFFVSKEEFLKLKDEDYFVETTTYNNNYYGTSKKEISDDKVLIVETSGAKVFLSLNDPHIIVFRLLASKDMRYSRMLERGDSLESIKQRLEKDVTWFADNNFIDKRIITIDTENLTLSQVAEKIHSRYIEELSKIR